MREETKIPEMRTPDRLYDLIKSKDPKTDLTRSALRRLIVTGVIPSVRIGQKYLVNVEDVWSYMRGELQPLQQKPEPTQRGIIRRIGV